MEPSAYKPLSIDQSLTENRYGKASMAKKTSFAVTDTDKILIRETSYYIREALFSCITDTQVECSVAFARYLSRCGLNGENYWLFLRLVMTNNPWVLEELLQEREPRLLFSTIRPSEELIETCFQALFSRHPEEIYPKALEALLGVIENGYFDADDGYRMRKLSIMDINALGKFLLKNEPQEHPINRLLLEILDKLTRLGEYFSEPDKSVLSKHAFNVRFAYFDNAREMVDTIPHPLLVRVPDRNVAGPEADFADLIERRRNRKRDGRGRFVKEDPLEKAEKAQDQTLAAPGAAKVAEAPASESAQVRKKRKRSGDPS